MFAQVGVLEQIKPKSDRKLNKNRIVSSGLLFEAHITPKVDVLLKPVLVASYTYP